ncbi:MAG: N-acetyltransferase [Planctomycetota bacterium]
MTAIRKAKLTDVPQMHRLINEFANRKLMLPRSLGELYENMRDFVVAEDGEKLIGCGALHIVWDDLGEVKCLAIAPEFQKQGIGTAIVRALLDEATKVGLKRVFSLTYQPQFFVHRGFQRIAKESLPHKIWSECIHCPQFPGCDEEAVTLNLGEQGKTPERPRKRPRPGGKRRKP